MYYVYVLVERESKRMYIGYTSDLRRRIKEHKEGDGAKYTKRGKWELVYYEAYRNEQDAREREQKLKQRGQSVRWLKERIKRSLTQL